MRHLHRDATRCHGRGGRGGSGELGGRYHGGDGKEGDEYNGERRDGERNRQCAYLARVPSQLLHDKLRAGGESDAGEGGVVQRRERGRHSRSGRELCE